MDSGNSGSMQSSSGGDEEYDSRGESISTFLNNNNNTNNSSLPHFGSISSHNNSHPFLSHHHQQQQQANNTFFDTAASLFPQSSNPQFSTNDLIWSSSRALRSDHNFNNFTASSSAPSSSNVVSAQLLHHNQNPFSGSGSGSGSLPTMQQPSSIEAANVVRASSSAQPDHLPNVAKNPKKRTRASRRAPTTVLTTDTTNFRQMVQEFTGIPTAPFTGSPYTRRLDLFSTAGSGMRSGHLDSLGPLYPLRPSPQKVQVSPFMPQLSSSSASSSSLLSSSMIDALMPTNNTGSSIVGVSTASASTSTSTNFQLGSNHLGIQKQAQNLFNMENQILTFNAGASVFNTKSSQGGGGGGGGGGSGNTINVPSLDELGISHEQQVSANLIRGFRGGNNNNNNNVSSQARNDGNNLSRLWRNNNHDGGQENQRLRSFDANNGGGNYKLNCSGNSSTSEFHHEINKGLENVCSTGEGPVSSWPCPSD